jgi:hypothetical protein
MINAEQNFKDGKTERRAAGSARASMTHVQRRKTRGEPDEGQMHE